MTCPFPRRSIAGFVTLMFALLAVGAAHAAPAPSLATPCDRACLTHVMDDYLSALVTHDRSKLPLAANVRATENGQVVKIGDGVWETATAKGKYRHDFVDPDRSEIATIATIFEGKVHSILAARLQVSNGRIDQIEAVVSRPSIMAPGDPMGQGADRLDALAKPSAVWFQQVPPAQRMSRDDLIRTANMYFSGLQGNDGHGVYPFSDDCQRIENGFRTTNQEQHIQLPGNKDGKQPYAYEFMKLGCKAQFEQGYYRFVTRIRDRRFVVVDPEYGTVFSFVFFDHNGTIPQVTLTNGRVVPTGLSVPFTWELAEAFKVEGGLIHRVEAIMTQAPYAMPPNWPTTSAEMPR